MFTQACDTAVAAGVESSTVSSRATWHVVCSRSGAMRHHVLLAFAALSLASMAGCHAHGRYGYTPGGYYYAQPQIQQRQAVYVQQQPAYYQQPQPQAVYVQQQQPVYVQQAQPQPVYVQQPVVLQSQPETYYTMPTGDYQRPAMWNGVRVYIAQ